MSLAAWIASLVPSLTSRVLAALGFGVVTFTGLTAVQNQLFGLIVQYLGQWPATAAQLAGLAGLDTAINLILAAIAYRVGLYTLTQGTRILGGPGT